MPIQRFTLTLGEIAEIGDDDAERLHAACDDISLFARNGVSFVAFDREAESFSVAVSSALRDIGKPGIAATISNVTADDPADRAADDEINRLLKALGRFERSDVHAWPVGQT